MSRLIEYAVGLVVAHPILAIVAAFVASIVEAVVVIGAILPGTPVLMAIAGASGLCRYSALPILAAAVLGAVLGDGISYLIGFRCAARLRGQWPFSRRPALLARADAFFAHHGAMAVGVARFLPLMRSTVPMIAGMSGMAPRRFWVVNIVSACLWAPAHVLPARLAGRSIERFLADGDWYPAAQTGFGMLLLAAAGWWLHRRYARRSLSVAGAQA